ncbi:MAG: Asp-tRNA(Asn)/Glu-tRNA(Gln) amidotransferase subunit GatA [Alphaproteobacteria bacterium]|nr:MAG: Asp-tRNA(Asn)/Glu-tRNA(Gln) amidotransferase subunit GatA [Alphaproteobacteria bacterium]
MSALTRLSLSEALDGLNKKEFCAVDLVQDHIKAVEDARVLNAFTKETPEIALAAAKESDARRAKGQAGPLDGIPIAVKDLYCTKGIETTACSNALRGFKPTYESTVTANLWRDGAVMLGKVGLDEFAMGSSNATSCFGPVINPWSPGKPGAWDKQLVPGGSSGGSAAAVAARCAMAATATDTGGSIRQPASVCGITGIRPSYGRCSRWGIVAFASSLDQAGPLARTVRDCAHMLRSMSGFDEKDSTSVNRPVPDYVAALTGDIRGLKVGIPREYRIPGIPAEIDALWSRGAAWLREAGAEIVEISLPHTKYALAAYYIIAPAEASSNLARYDGVRYGTRVEGEGIDQMYENSRGAAFGKEVRRRILIGTYVLSAGYYDAYYLRAQKVRTRIAQDFEHAYTQCDVILTPTAPGPAFAIGEKQDDPIAMYLEDVFTVPVNLAATCGLSVPAGLSAQGLPLGLQLIGRPFDEETVLRVGDVLEKAANFHALPPFLAG